MVRKWSATNAQISIATRDLILICASICAIENVKNLKNQKNSGDTDKTPPKRRTLVEHAPTNGAIKAPNSTLVNSIAKTNARELVGTSNTCGR